MRFIIPPNTTFSQRVFELLCQWFVACGLTLTDIDGTQPIYIDTDDGTLLTTIYGVVKAPITQPIPDLVIHELRAYVSAEPFPGVMELAEAKIARDKHLDEIDIKVPSTEVAPLIAELVDTEMPEGGPPLPMDDMAIWIDQLRTARTDAADAKSRADEARDQILSRLINENRHVGTIDGRPAVEWKPISSQKFQTSKFKAANPELAEKYTETSTSNRLDIL